MKPLNWFKKYNLLIFDEVDSTNLEARRLVEHNIAGNFVIVSSKQSKGRGSYSRSWVSLEGNLHCSILLKTYSKISLISQLSFVTSLAIYDTINFFANSDCKISLKWPNDILVNGAKISGILLESILLPSSDIVNYVIVGVGINIKNSPDNLNRKTTSLFESFGVELSPDKVLDQFMNYFEKYYYKWQMEGFVKLRKIWLSRAQDVNQVVTLVSQNNRVSGTFLDIDVSGAIRLKLASGQICNFEYGELYN